MVSSAKVIFATFYGTWKLTATAVGIGGAAVYCSWMNNKGRGVKGNHDPICLRALFGLTTMDGTGTMSLAKTLAWQNHLN